MTRSSHPLLACLAAVLLAVVAALPAPLAAQSSGVPLPLETILDADGALALPEGASGSFDPSGWIMSTGPDGAPHFYRKDDPRLMEFPGDEHWDSRFGPPGIGGPVYAVAAWGDEVYIGGVFQVAGTVLANNVVAFDTRTRTWRQLGNDVINGAGGPVYALAVHAGQLYVGGTFESAGGISASGIARWDIARQRWAPLGGGVASVENTWIYAGHVYAIVADSQSVFVGGVFLMADADSVYNLARWDLASQSWSAACKADVNGTNGAIQALALDGGSLYVGGSFTSVADITASRIARWDLEENTWHPLGDGFNGTVQAITSFGGRIIAGGRFTASGTTATRNIAEWNGSAWRQLGPGLDSSVHALRADGGSLYVGGLFRAPATGAVALNGVARWTGGGYAQVGLGIADDTLPLVRSLAVVGGTLYAGGNFTAAGIAAAYSVAQWDTVWSALGAPKPTVMHGTDAEVHALAIRGDDVYIGGDFSTAGGVAARRVARWNRSSGEWFPLGSGIDGTGSLVRAMTFDDDGTLYVGGIFAGAGGVASRGVVAWDGSRWRSLDGGVGGEAPFVFALDHDGEALYVGGAFESAGSTGGGVRSPLIARWGVRSGVWTPVAGGIEGDTAYTYVAAIAARDGRVVVGGEFTMQGSLRVNRLLELAGSSWAPIGRPGSYGVNAPVSALAIDGDDVIVGGDFTRAGIEPHRFLARWDGSAWRSDTLVADGPVRALRLIGRTLVVGGELTRVGSRTINRVATLDLERNAWRTLASGTNGTVYAVEAIADEIYAGGSFSSAGGARTANIAQWRGDAWSAMGSDPSIGINDTVFALVVRGRDIFVGGRFRTAGGVRTNGIARWDGSRWKTVGRGFGGPLPIVHALALAPNGDLYAGGSFVVAGTDTARGVARWDGTRWHPVGTGIRGGGANTPPATVRALAIGEDAIYAAGEFSRAGDVAATNVARFTPSTGTWSALGAGLRRGRPFPAVYALAIHDGMLVAGGRFDSAGAVAAHNVARWDGSAWLTMGTFSYDGRALLVRGGELVAAAGFYERVNVPPSTPIFRSGFHLLRWTGTEWNPFSGGTGIINSLAFDDRGRLYVGGTIGMVGEVAVSGVARWSDSAWANLGSGLVGLNYLKAFTIGSALAMAAVGDDLYVGGNFIVAGRKPSYYFGRWNESVSGAPAEPARLAIDGIAVSVAPNPIDRHATLRLDAAAPITAVRLYDMLGNERLARTTGLLSTLELGTLESGAYIVRIETTKGVGVGRIVVR